MLLRHLCVALLLTAAAAAGAQPALFASASSKTDDLTPRQAQLFEAARSAAGVQAVEIVRADAALLQSASSVQVSLFGTDVVLASQSVERRASADLSWAGRDATAGIQASGAATAVLVAREGRITGTIWSGGFIYDVRPLTGGLHVIVRTSPEAYRDHDDTYDAFEQEQKDAQQIEPGSGAASSPEAGGGPLKASLVPVVDVIVPYTTDVTAAYADPGALAQAAIDASNLSYANTGLGLRLNLVHAYETSGASSGDTSTDLTAITGTTDGTYDEVHSLRDAFGADMVALLGASSDAYGGCGRGYINSDAGSAFTVTAPDCAVGNLTFAHELGHNFGARHDPFVDASTTPYEYGHGYVNTEGRWRTVMAYNNECSQSLPTGFSCTRLPYWSDPDVIYDDTTMPEADGPTGESVLRDNARVLEERGATVAAFRATSTPPALAYSPGSFSLSLAPGGTSTLAVTLQNTALAGASPLAYAASLQDYGGNSLTVSGGPAPEASKAALDCTDGQLYSQTAFTTAPTATTTFEYGQSWTAPCSGTLTSVSVGNYPQFQPDQVWTATLRVYEGDGTTGTQIISEPVSHTNPGSGLEYVSVPLASPIEMTAGESYTWFLDMDSGMTALLYSTDAPDTGGQAYQTSNGTPAGAIGQSGYDMAYQLRFGAPDRWASVAPASGTIAQGASGEVTVSVDATGLTAGVYTVDLVLDTNDPEAMTATLPITLYVSTGAAAASIDGDAGWRLFAPAAPGMTVASLSGLNRVSGVPGYDEASGSPNLLTGYDGTTLIGASGGSEALELGEGFWWYLYDVNFSDGPTNQSYALPFTLATPLAPTTSDVDVTLHADGSKVNLLGNPFGQSLDLSGMNTWTGKDNLLTPVVAIYNSGTNTYSYSTTTPVVSAWQGFYAYGETAGTLTIPEAARTTGGTLVKQDDRMFLAFELSESPEAAYAEGREPLADLGAVLYFDAAASAGQDVYDLAELAPVDARHVTLAFGAESASGATELRGHEGRSPSGGAFEIPLHVATAGAAPALDLTWPSLDRIPEDWSVTLLDLETGSRIDLRDQDVYSFDVASQSASAKARLRAPSAQTLSADGVPARFMLHVTPAFTTSASPEASGEWSLKSPMPNPVRERATLRFSLASAGEATLAVYDVQGREVARLAKGLHASGDHAVDWNTSTMAAGVYVVRLAAGDRVLTQRAVVVR